MIKLRSKSEMAATVATQSKKSARCFKSGRLVYYQRQADDAFWDSHWETHFNPEHYDWFEKGNLGLFERLFPRWLPREGKILEAGCGPAHYVVALRARGHDAEGVDFSQKTIKRIQHYRPNLPVRVGDVTGLDVPDGYYAGYVSLGVVEHLEKGPEPFLKEAFRILRPGGIAIVSVPYMNILRSRKARQGKYDKSSEGLNFYQYAFSREEFSGLMQSVGFEIADIDGYDPFKGVKDEVPVVSRLRHLSVIGRPFQKFITFTLNAVPVFRKGLSHMLVVVGRKPGGD